VILNFGYSSLRKKNIAIFSCIFCFIIKTKTTNTMTDTYDDDRKAGESFATVALHHGQTLDSDHRARAPPIYASTSFAFEDAAHGADLFALKKLGPIYTRIMNPTAHVLEYRIAKLEGSGCDLDGAHPSALATASGQSAQMMTGKLKFRRKRWSYLPGVIILTPTLNQC
jgi:hypothetical protein